MDNKKGKIKKLNFKRRQAYLKKLADKWRRPRGLHNKLRLQKKGKGRVPGIGYGKKKNTDKPSRISKMSDFENSGKNVIISSKVGLRKKIELIKKAQELKLNILNLKDAGKYIEAKLNKKKELKKKSGERKNRREEKVKKRESKKEQASKEDKAKQEKEEKKKVLEQKL